MFTDAIRRCLCRWVRPSSAPALAIICFLAISPGARAQAGACCLCTGQCIDNVPQSFCISQNGIWTPNTPCSQVNCREYGACCVPGVGCFDDVPFGNCNQQGGQFFPCQDCTDVPCSNPNEQSCCFCDGTCQDLFSFDCTALGGTPAAGFCATVQCPRTGACCLQPGAVPNCIDNISDVNCFAIGGVSFFLCKTCADVDCDPDNPGACCFCDGNCADLFTFDCIALGGSPTAGLCAAVQCPKVGACCITVAGGNTCVDNVTESDCYNLLGGYFFWECMDCTQIICDPPQQACCLCDGTCIDLLPVDCLSAAFNGVPQGPGTTCASVQCIPYGACCFLEAPGGPICQDNVSIVNCPTFGAVFYPCQTCDEVPCGEEACCFCDGTCQDLPPQDCLNAGGTPQGPGTMCSTHTCPRTGACCIDGVCIDNLTANQCVQQGGVFHLCLTCDEILCEPTGACCFTCEPPPPSPPCPDPRPAGPPCVDNVTKSMCELTLHGVYRGDGSMCITATGAPLCRCRGDINGDGVTNIADFNILAGMFGGGIPNCKLHTQGDLNCDGVVNAADFNILAGDFGCQ